MVEKAGFAVGPLIIGWLLSSAGYSAATGPGAAVAATSAATRIAILFGVAFIPAATSALAVLVLYRYNLTESMLRTMIPPRLDSKSPC